LGRREKGVMEEYDGAGRGMVRGLNDSSPRREHRADSLSRHRPGEGEELQITRYQEKLSVEKKQNEETDDF